MNHMIFEEEKKLLLASLRRLHLEPDQKLGQNFLLLGEILQAIVTTAGLTSSDTVLEVGPGAGNLTGLLLEKAGRVVAVEKDERFRPLLSALAQGNSRLDIVYGDILRMDLAAILPKRFKVVANLPYYLTSVFLRLLLHGQCRPESLTVLVQKEVAENMTARPGRTNLLSLSVQTAGRPQIVRLVPAAAFYPEPTVESAVVHVDIGAKFFASSEEEQWFFRIARAAFAGKRKQLHNSLQHNLQISPESAATALSAAGIRPKARPQELSVNEFRRLSSFFIDLF